MQRPDLGSDTSSNGISAVVPHTSFLGETGGGVASRSVLKFYLKNSCLLLVFDYKMITTSESASLKKL